MEFIFVNFFIGFKSQCEMHCICKYFRLERNFPKIFYLFIQESEHKKTTSKKHVQTSKGILVLSKPNQNK